MKYAHEAFITSVFRSIHKAPEVSFVYNYNFWFGKKYQHFTRDFNMRSQII